MKNPYNLAIQFKSIDKTIPTTKKCLPNVSYLLKPEQIIQRRTIHHSL